MKITAVHAFRPEIAFTTTFSFGSIDRREPFNVLVRIQTDEGIVGTGEACPVPAFTSETPGSIVAALNGPIAELLIGTDPRTIRHLLQQVRAMSEGPFTTTAVDIAVWDILGRAADLPIHALLGGHKRGRVPQHGSVGMGNTQTMIETATAQVQQGYQMLKLYAGRETLDTDLARIRAVHDTVGPAIDIMLDVNGRWDRDQCRKALPPLAEAGVTILEQPLPATDLDGMAEATTQATGLSVQIMADEAVYTPHDVATIAQHKAAHTINLGISKLGGILAAHDCAQVATANGLRVCVGSVLELGVASTAGLHVSAALNDLAAPSYLIGPLKYTDQITAPPITVIDGAVAVPRTAGLGIQVVPDTPRVSPETR